MRSKLLCLFVLLFLSLANYAQEITYDTTYQVTYENGVKDSVIVIYKRVVVTEKVYIVDSSGMVRISYDVFAAPIFSWLSKKASDFTSSGYFNQNYISNHLGQALGTHLYINIKKWDFRTGISLARHSIKANSQSESQEIMVNTFTRYDTLDTYVSDNQIFVILDSTEVSVEELLKIQHQKKARLNLYYLNIPVQLGYKTEYKNIDISLYAGPVISVLLFGSGEALNERGNYTSDIRNHTEKIILQLEANIQVGYSLNEKIHLFGEPYFQKYISGFNHYNSIYSSDIMGFRAGVKFSL